MSAMYQSTLMMILFDLDQQRIDKACSSMQRQVESMFLLPQLKTSIQTNYQDSSSRRAEPPMSSDQQVCYHRRPSVILALTRLVSTKLV